jgi:hypothetical protein
VAGDLGDGAGAGEQGSVVLAQGDPDLAGDRFRWRRSGLCMRRSLPQAAAAVLATPGRDAIMTAPAGLCEIVSLSQAAVTGQAAGI